MVEHRHGISMLSELIISERKANVKFVPIVPYVSRKLALALRTDMTLSAAHKRFIAITKECVRTV
jgi:DNA-binding transcriptional LysR family regulator